MNTDRRVGFNIDFAVVSGIKFYPIYDGRQWFVSRCGQVLGAKGNVLVLRDNGKGYKVVSYQEANGKIRNKYVHRLVAGTFLEKSGTLVNHKDGRLIFDGILQALHTNGLVRRRGKQRLDSTHILGAVARMGRLEVVRETMRLLLEVVQMMDLQASLDDWTVFFERYVDSDIAWHKVSKETLKTKYQQAGDDMLSIIDWAKEHPSLLEHPQYLLLERVFGEQYEITEQGLKRRKHEGSGVVKNPHDPEVQWSSKDRDHKKKNWEGYKAQIAESIPEGDASQRKKGQPTTGFITEVSTTEAIASDFAGRETVEKKQEEHGLGVADEQYLDSGYISANTLAQAGQEGRQLMGPARPSPNSSGKLFTAEAFDVTIAEGRAICPRGLVSTQCSRLENQKTGQVDYRFEWSYHCDDCPLQTQCTKARSGRRAILVSEYHDHLFR